MSIPVPSGDPASLRFVAQRLRGIADDLCASSDEIRGHLSTMTYESDGAERFREAVLHAHQRVHAQASALGERARLLEQRARDIELALATGGVPS